MTSFIRSVLFGSPGTYNVFGLTCNFAESLPSPSPINRAAFAASQTYLQQMVHETGHVLADKILVNNSPYTINIASNGHSSYDCEKDIPTSLARETAIVVAGPVASLLLSSGKLIAVAALKNTIPKPISLFIAASSLIMMANDLYLEASNHSCTREVGTSGIAHSLFKTAAIVSACAPGIVALKSLFYN